MRILVIGGTRGIGSEVVRQALERGHQVRVMARHATPEQMPGAEVVAGDATRAQDLAAAVAGMDAVIVTLGLPKTPAAFLPRTTVFSESARAIIAAMHAAGVRRLLTVTGLGAGDSASALSTPERMLTGLLLGRAYADKTVEETLIRDSGLDWTIARPGLLTNTRRSGRYSVLVEPATWRNGLISRADVADFLVGAAEQGTYMRQAPVLVR